MAQRPIEYVLFHLIDDRLLQTQQQQQQQQRQLKLCGMVDW